LWFVALAVVSTLTSCWQRKGLKGLGRNNQIMTLAQTCLYVDIYLTHTCMHDYFLEWQSFPKAHLVIPITSPFGHWKPKNKYQLKLWILLVFRLFQYLSYMSEGYKYI
jgi:hypothetical protein